MGCFGDAFTTGNPERKITFVYTFDQREDGDKRMPGLMLRWETVQEQWPEKVVEVFELGREVRSPDFGKKWTEDKDWGQARLRRKDFPNFIHTNYRSYSAIFLLTSDVVQEVKKEGKLVVQIEMDPQEGEVYVQEGIKRWQIFDSKFELGKSWNEAEERCVEYGGHLASVTKDEIIPAGKCWIGSNGTKAEGWRWSDGSTWNFTNFWKNGYTVSKINRDICVVALNDGTWKKEGCGNKNCFVCSFKRSPTKTFLGKQKLTFEFHPDDLPLPFINITFAYNSTQSTKSKVKNRSKIPGFTASWRAVETLDVKKIPQKDWKHNLFHQNEQEALFLLTASFVTDMLNAGKTAHDIKGEAFDVKHQQIEKGLLKDCNGGLLPESLYFKMLQNLKGKTNRSISIKTAYPSKLSMETSLELYFLLSQCSEEGQKALNLIKQHKHRPATLLQATVNSLHRGRFKESSTRDNFKDFYSLLENELSMEHGKILMALGSPKELAILKNDLPYLDKYKTEVSSCLEVGAVPKPF